MGGQTGNVDSTMITDGTVAGADLASDIGVSTTGNIETTGSGTITSAGLLTASAALTVTSTLTANDNVVLGSDNTDTLTVSATIQGGSPLVFEGASSNANELTIAITDPTADRTITFPDETGTVVLTGQTGNVDSTMIADGTVAGLLTASAGLSVT